MTDSTGKAMGFRNDEDGGTLETLASRALGTIASRRMSAASLLSEKFVSDLDAAARSIESDRRRAVVAAMRDAGIGREDIVDFYIPEVARRMGVEWCEDGMSFADVTIGVARLQGLLREIGSDWLDGAGLTRESPGVAVVVTADEFHTLGSMVLCSQLARLGVSVRLVVGRSQEEVLGGVADGHFDAIFISAASGRRLATLRKLVENIREASDRPTPIIIGGPIVAREDDVKTKTGADHVTTDPTEALAACGLKISHSGARRRATSE